LKEKPAARSTVEEVVDDAGVAGKAGYMEEVGEVLLLFLGPWEGGEGREMAPGG
jgi:hypothetical protein